MLGTWDTEKMALTGHNKVQGNNAARETWQPTRREEKYIKLSTSYEGGHVGPTTHDRKLNPNPTLAWQEDVMDWKNAPDL